MSIIINNLTKKYGVQKAVNNISLKINSGEIVGLLGPNGAGKSTMMKIISCYIPQTSGDVFVCGHDVVNDAIKVREKVGYLPENNPQYTDMYVKEYLTFIAGIYKLGKKTKSRVDEMINITGLEIEQNKKIGQLSKGYRQRVGIAQALIHDPEVLILDEPTSGLDPNQLIDIRNLIKDIGKEKTVLLSTHIMQEVEAVCDRVIIIDRGNIVADNTPDKLNSESTEEESITVQVEFNSPVLEEDLLRISGVNKAKNINNNEWLLEGIKDIRTDIFDFAVQKNIAVLSMQKKIETLEDTFRKLTS